MALTFTNTIDGGLRVWNLGNGLKMAQIDMTSSSVSGDYSSGFDLASNAGKMGFRKIFQVIGATLRATAGTTKLLVPLWDVTTGKLRFLEAATADGPFTDADVASGELVDGDIVRMVVIGV